MFTADRLALQLRFWPLLSGKVELPEIVLENPVVAVEKKRRRHLGQLEYDRGRQTCACNGQLGQQQ